MVNEHSVFTGIQGISMSQSIRTFFDEPLDLTFDILLPEVKSEAPKQESDSSKSRVQNSVTDSTLKH